MAIDAAVSSLVDYYNSIVDYYNSISILIHVVYNLENVYRFCNTEIIDG